MSLSWFLKRKNGFDIYSDASSIVSSNDGMVPRRSYRVNVRCLCQIITLSAKCYYYKNKDKFNFFNYKILDCDHRSYSLSGTMEKEGKK